MLRNLSPRERDAIIELGKSGPGGNLDHLALSKLFTLDLVTISDDRRIVLTSDGKEIYRELAKLT